MKAGHADSLDADRVQVRGLQQVQREVVVLRVEPVLLHQFLVRREGVSQGGGVIGKRD